MRLARDLDLPDFGALQEGDVNAPRRVRARRCHCRWSHEVRFVAGTLHRCEQGQAFDFELFFLGIVKSTRKRLLAKMLFHALPSGMKLVLGCVIRMGPLLQMTA